MKPRAQSDADDAAFQIRASPPSPPSECCLTEAASGSGDTDSTTTPQQLISRWSSVVPARAVVLTVETAQPPHPNAQAFEASLRSRGWPLHIVGAGLPWRGVFQKVHLYAEVVAGLQSDTLVVLSDARDVLCTRGPDDNFLREFLSFGAPIVVSMEMFCDGVLDYAPTEDASRRHCADLTPYWAARGLPTLYPRGVRKFVNSGLIVGYAPAVLHYLRWALDGHARGEFTKDQLALGRYMCAHPAMVAADMDAVLLHTSGAGCYAGRVAAEQAADSPSLAELHGRTSYFLHCPGIATEKDARGAEALREPELAGQLAYYRAAQEVVHADAARVLALAAAGPALEPPLPRGRYVEIK